MKILYQSKANNKIYGELNNVKQIDIKVFCGVQALIVTCYNDDDWTCFEVNDFNFTIIQ